jgi:hypothetical protein
VRGAGLAEFLRGCWECSPPFLGRGGTGGSRGDERVGIVCTGDLEGCWRAWDFQVTSFGLPVIQAAWRALVSRQKFKSGCNHGVCWYSTSWAILEPRTSREVMLYFSYEVNNYHRLAFNRESLLRLGINNQAWWATNRMQEWAICSILPPFPLNFHHHLLGGQQIECPILQPIPTQFPP